MFSGIVHGKATVTRAHLEHGVMSLELRLGDLVQDLRRGASVAVSGVCLTAVDIEGDRVTFDVIGETLVRTTLGSLRNGDEVNIERSVRVGDEIGGHRVSGHITGVATILDIQRSESNRIVKFSCSTEWMDAILPKGFIALDGCSLTIVDVGADWFTVHLIPETLRVTTFGQKTVGNKVNLELDPETQAIVATVKRYLRPSL